MTTSYTSLFSVSISHTYFASGNCESLQYKAMQNTQKIIDKYGFVLRLHTNGFELYTNTNQSIDDYLNYIQHVTETDTFEFTGIVTDQNFYNYTAEIPLTEIGVLSYENTNNLTTGNSIELSKKFSPQSDVQNPVQIKILFKDIIDAHNLNSNTTFQIQLHARKTQWHYNIINSSNQNFDELEVESNTPDIQFSNKGETTLQNGQTALLFSSGEDQLPLKNVPEYNFDLINTKTVISGSRKETIFKGLPIPDAANLQIVENDVIASLMYIYI